MGLSCDDVLGQSLEVVGEINVYAILIMAPPALFLFFLLAKLRSAIKILRETAGVRLFRSAALAFIWVICFVNIGRVAVQVLIPTSFPIWKFMWLLLRSMFTFSQVAVAAFIFVLILHDVSFEQFISSLRLDSVTKRILLQTLISSTLVSCFELIVQVVLMFAMDEPIYSTTDSAEIAAVFWIIRGVLLLTVYFGLLVLLHVYPPIKDYTICETNYSWWYSSAKILNVYCWILAFLNLLDLLGWTLILIGLEAGDCMIGIGIFMYYSGFPPLVYLVFMARFFQTDEHWPLSDESSSEEKTKRRRDRKKESESWKLQEA